MVPEDRAVLVVPEAEDLPVQAAVNQLMNALLIAKIIRKNASSLVLREVAISREDLAVALGTVFRVGREDFKEDRAAVRVQKNALRIVKIIQKNVRILLLRAAVAQEADSLVVLREAEKISSNTSKAVHHLVLAVHHKKNCRSGLAKAR